MDANKNRAKTAKGSDLTKKQPSTVDEKKRVSQRITRTQLAKVLGTDRIEGGINSVPSPSAQIDELCTPASEQAAGWQAITDNYVRIAKQSKRLAAVYGLLIEGALRISEVLAIKPSDIDAQGKVSITALKRSTSRIVVSSLARDYLITCAKRSIAPFSEMNRFHVYREFKKLGIGIQVPGNKNKSITHVGKHLFALAAKDANFDVKQLQMSLGHKAASSTAQYGRKK